MKATDLKIGDFITGSYKYGCVSGIVKKINKNTVVVNQHSEYYNTYTALNKDLNITISRIQEVNPIGIILK